MATTRLEIKQPQQLILESENKNKSGFLYYENQLLCKNDEQRPADFTELED